MPGRSIPIVTGEIYHTFNRGIDRRPTFTSKKEYGRAIDAIRFYLSSPPPLSLSKYLRLEKEKQVEIDKVLAVTKKNVQILSFCLMPNHFHFLLRQEKNNGIPLFLSNFQNSYTRYFNIKHDRVGSLFLDQFKAVRIETEEQLVHVSRYIHLNPHSGYIIKSIQELENYPWSSFSEYLRERETYIDKKIVLSLFKNTYEYKTFVYNQADYQRRLKEIDHLIFD